MIVASAEPKPIRLASPTTFWVTRARDQLQPVAALVDHPDEVERAQRLDHGDHEDDDVDRPHDREDDPEERLRLATRRRPRRPRAAIGSTPFSPAR